MTHPAVSGAAPTVPTLGQSASSSAQTLKFDLARITKAPGANAPLIAERISFEEYMHRVYAAPHLLLRNSAQYLADAIEFFGYTSVRRLGREIKSFDCMRQPWLAGELAQAEGLIGQEAALYKIWQTCRELGRAPHPEKQIIIHGPAGAGKTSLLEIVLGAVQEYSYSEAGALYRLAFKVRDELAKASVARIFAQSQEANRDSTFRLEGKESIIESGWNTDPFSLLSSRRERGQSASIREEVVRELQALAPSAAEADPETGAFFNSGYALWTRLDPLSTKILFELARSRDKDLARVYAENVVVERWVLDGTCGVGINELGTFSDPYAQRELVTFGKAAPGDRQLPELSEAEQVLARHGGPVPRSNRGLLVHTDMLRFAPGTHVQNIGGYNHLLDTIQHGKYGMGGPVGRLSFLGMATTTDVDAVKAANNPNYDWATFARRTVFISAPNIRRACDEEQLVRRAFGKYLENDVDAQVESGALPRSRQLDPHVIRLLSLFLVASRTFPPQSDDLAKREERLGFLGKKPMELLEKVMLLDEKSGAAADGELNLFRFNSEAWTAKELEALRANVPLIAEQYQHGVGTTRFLAYEGGSGIPSSKTDELVASVIRSVRQGPITLLKVLEHLERLSEGGFPHYAEIERVRKEEVDRRFKRLKRDARAEVQEGGDLPTDKVLRKSAEAQLDKEWRYPRAREVLAQAERWGRQVVRYDLHKAYETALNTKDNSLRRYLAHLSAYVNSHVEVAVEFRRNRFEKSSRADLELMEEFEDLVTAAPEEEAPESGKGKKAEKKTFDREAFRRQTFSKFSVAATAPGAEPEQVMANLETLFPELVKNLSLARQKEREKKEIAGLVTRIQLYVDPEKLDRDVANGTMNKELEIYRGVMSYLEEKAGYPRSAIAELVTWAFKPQNSEQDSPAPKK